MTAIDAFSAAAEDTAKWSTVEREALEQIVSTIRAGGTSVGQLGAGQLYASQLGAFILYGDSDNFSIGKLVVHSEVRRGT